MAGTAATSGLMLAPVGNVYPSCTAARAAGAAPIYAGQPGYSRKLDLDGDGVRVRVVGPPARAYTTVVTWTGTNFDRHDVNCLIPASALP